MQVVDLKVQIHYNLLLLSENLSEHIVPLEGSSKDLDRECLE